MTTYKRTWREVMDDFPKGEVRTLTAKNGQRDRALIHVLRIAPVDDYNKLKKCLPQFRLFGPPKANLGQVDELFRYPYVLYLDPALEEDEITFDRVLAVVAHELIHIVKGHDFNASYEKYWGQEVEAWKCTCEWGFEEGVTKHLSLQKMGYTVTVKFNPGKLSPDLEKLIGSNREGKGGD